MPDQPQSIPSPALDLSRHTEGTRRQLYDLIVKIQFTPPSPDAATSPEESWVPAYTPDEAGLTVFYALGRWFATWVQLDELHLPEHEKIELVRIEPDADTTYGIMLYEV